MAKLVNKKTTTTTTVIEEIELVQRVLSKLSGGVEGTGYRSRDFYVVHGGTAGLLQLPVGEFKF